MTEERSPANIIRQMRAQLAMYDFLLPGNFVPEAPSRKRWFRWRPAFQITDDMIQWAGALARARSLMDLENAASMVEDAEISVEALRSAVATATATSSSFGPAGTVLADTVLAHSITSTGVIEIQAMAGADEPINLREAPEVAAMRYIEQLRAGHGHSVEILCDDEEATSRKQQMAVECLGDWTDWKRVRFYGEDVVQCLAKAVFAHDTWEEPSVALVDDTDALVVRMLYELHSHVPEDQRPVSMSDLSDEQAERARKAVNAVVGSARMNRAAIR